MNDRFEHMDVGAAEEQAQAAVSVISLPYWLGCSNVSNAASYM
jgi:hypothetical protein